MVTHGIEATCASPNGIEAKCASPRWRPNPEIDWHRDRYPRDMINPAGRNHVNRQRSPSSNAIIYSFNYQSEFSIQTLTNSYKLLWFTFTNLAFNQYFAYFPLTFNLRRFNLINHFVSLFFFTISDRKTVLVSIVSSHICDTLILHLQFMLK